MKRLKKKGFIFACKQVNRKIPDPRNAKGHQKSVKESKLITYQPKAFKNSKIVNIKPVITEHSKTLNKLSKTIRQAKKVGSNSVCLIVFFFQQ